MWVPTQSSELFEQEFSFSSYRLAGQAGPHEGSSPLQRKHLARSLDEVLAPTCVHPIQYYPPSQLPAD